MSLVQETVVPKLPRARRRGPRALAKAAAGSPALEAARAAGLFDGDLTEHLSFRAPKALVEAARRETGAETVTELGLLALSMLAQPDPVVAFMERTRGALGEAAELDY